MSILHWLEHYIVVIMTVVVATIIVTTYWPGRKSRIEQAALIPFKDDV